MAIDADHDNEARSVAPGDESRGLESIPVKVNGVEIEVLEEVRVQELIEMARAKGAIAGTVDEYVIERVTEDGELRGDEIIRISEREEFLAVPVEPTTVA